MTDRETFRHVIGHFASGVTVLTARHGGADFGATASAVSSLSLDPPMLLVCMNLRGSTQQAIQESRKFGVNILDEDRVTSPSGSHHPGESGSPGSTSNSAAWVCHGSPTPWPL
jgi:flavin reductase (DIM6/NTAB) family NADH-FMN oxidoreductase RutF